MREMKDSGIGWVHEIPNNWTVVKGKYIFNIKKQVVGARVDDYERLALTLNGVIKRAKDDNEGLQPDKFNTYQILRKNELVFKLIDLQNISTSRVGLSHYTGIVSPAYIILKATKQINPVFAEKYYLMMWMNQVFNALGDSGVRSGLNSNELLEISLPLPSHDEQIQIADFLDEKCAEIDGITKDLQEQIDILEDYKKSVITEAVTKGLNKNAKMKDSGIDYIKYISKNRFISKLKYVLKEPMKYGASESGVDYDSDLPRYIRITDISLEGELKDDSKLSLTNKQANGYILKNNTILFARSGATVGKTFLYNSSYGKSAFAGYLISCVPNEGKVNPKWVYYCVNSSYYWEWCNRIFTQATIQNIGADKYSCFPLVVASIDEQNNIVKYLDNALEKIQSVISNKKKQLNILDEYKKSLIYEYVTGKKEVKNT